MQHVPRFYVSDDLCVGVEVVVRDDVAHHVRHVLRMREGSDAFIFNGRDGEYRAKLIRSSRDGEVFMLGDFHREQSSDCDLWLCVGILKNDIMGNLVERATELRVSHIVPIVTSHGVSKFCPIDKFRLRAVKASQQCERLTVPSIYEPVALEDLHLVIPEGINFFGALERGEHEHLWTALEGVDKSGALGLLVGPSGGFSDSENDYLSCCDYLSAVSLGCSLLRSETACMMGLSLMYSLMNL